MADKMEERIKALEKAMVELQDDRAIRELLARYGFNADLDRTEAWVGLFTEDGIMNLGSGGKIQSWQGREELRKWISSQLARTQPEKYGKRMHVQGNNLVTHINGSEAVVNSYSIVLRMVEGQMGITAGNNRWTLRKINGHWYIKERFRRELGGAEYRKALDTTPE